MRLLLRVCFIAMLLVFYMLLCAEMRKEEEPLNSGKSTNSIIKVRKNYTAANDRRPENVTLRKKVRNTGRKRVSRGPQSDSGCIRLGGICQPNRYVCRGHYLEGKCSGAKLRQCCLQAGAWSVLCAGHHNNRVRACDAHACGAFNSKRGNGLHKAVDLVCDDYSVINAPFSGSLAGPVSQKDPAGNQYDGVKLLSDVHCVEIFNIRPYHFLGPVAQGEALGYLLPLQERFDGITSHVELRMCDGSDPSSFI
ncbi:leukocyte cell-derived chemotaxin-2-like [Melanotaenia boesemani]|uniref:leukocyte cell-derived chemotaxin-2-like n=1 Tax=Melanotaenia boesemani TaxID=1250792 RepID=UPI001C03BA7E|nr:leukocyte cell-derived chemotaxin-2-like [Melanotaenia boesemani]